MELVAIGRLLETERTTVFSCVPMVEPTRLQQIAMIP